MPRLRLTIAYSGTNYHGWQVQALRQGEDPATIQACLEKAVSHVAGEAVHVHGSGRTDAGVHAEAQTAIGDRHRVFHVDRDSVADGKGGKGDG